MSLHRVGTKWVVRWRDGTRNRSRQFDRKPDAVLFESELRRRRQLGGLHAITSDLTLAAFVEDWWQLHAIPNLAAATRRNYSHIWAKHLHPRIGALKLAEISPRTVAKLRADLLSEGVGEPTVRRVLAVLQSILTLAVTEERLDSNPVAKVRKPIHQVARKVEPFTPVEVEALRQVLNLRDATMVSVLAYAGLRPGEALALTWRDVGNRTLRIRRSIALGVEKKTKTGGERSVRLFSALSEDLKAWHELSDDRTHYIFPRKDRQPWQQTDWRNWQRRIFRPAAEQIGREKARPYDLRHSFVSLLIQEGQTVIEVARQAGHSAETCLRYYAHVFAEYDPADRVNAEEQIRRARQSNVRHMFVNKDANFPSYDRENPEGGSN